MWDGVDLYACTDNSSTRFCFVIKKRKGGFKQKHYFKPTGAALWGSTPSFCLLYTSQPTCFINHFFYLVSLLISSPVDIAPHGRHVLVDSLRYGFRFWKGSACVVKIDLIHLPASYLFTRCV